MRLFQFKDLIGNRATLTPLFNQIHKNLVPNFIILGGELGMGKTTAAIILSMRLTCQNPNGIEPCLECDFCKRSLDTLGSEGKNLSVHMLDMSAVEDPKEMSELVENIFSQRGIAGKAVYILEEFQELTSKNQKKMLHELDKQDKGIHVIATCTDLHKIEETVKSRTVPYIFNRLSREESSILTIREFDRLGMPKPSSSFIDIIVRSAKGVARNITELVNFAKDADLTAESMRAFLGEVPMEEYIVLLEAIEKDDSFVYTHLEDSLLRYSIGAFIDGYKGFVEKLEFLRGVGTSAYFTDDESDKLKKLDDRLVNLVLEQTLRLPHGANSTEIRLSFMKLIKSIRGKSVIQTNKEKAFQDHIIGTSNAVEAEKVSMQSNAFSTKATGDTLRRLMNENRT